jgi:hypothetical protein
VRHALREERPLDPYERDLLDNVEKFGWQCISVAADDGAPSFSYTIGFWESLCTPELVIFGLDFDLMHAMLWEMYRHLKAGAQLADGARWPILEGFDCISRQVHASNVQPDYLNSAIWYRHLKTGDESLEVFQLFWPSAEQGLFPWEEGCDPLVGACQPLLYLPADANPA